MALGGIPPINNATATSSTFPLAAQHFWNKTPEQQITMLGAQAAPLYWRLVQGMGIPKKTSTDQRFEIFTEHPQIRDVIIYGDDGTTAAGTNGTTTVTTSIIYFTMTDLTDTITDARKLVQVGDTLQVHPNQDTQTATAGTVAAAGETMLILAISSDGGYITVERNHGSTANTANVTTGASTANWFQAEIQSDSRSSKARSRSALAHADQTDYNYIQTFEVPYEVDLDTSNTLLVGGDLMPRQQKSKLITMMGNVDRAIMDGRRDIAVSDGDPAFYTGGFRPLVVGDTTTYGAYIAANDLVTGTGSSRIWNVGSKNNFSTHNWLTFIERLYSEGSQNKVLICGPGFFTMFLQALEGYLTMELTGSTGIPIGMEVMAWNHGYGKPLEFMNYPAWRGPRSYDAMVLDYDYIGLMGFGDTNGELNIWKGKGGLGLEENDSRVPKHSWFTQLGANITYPLAHAYITGVKNDNGLFGGPNATVGTLTPSDT